MTMNATFNIQKTNPIKPNFKSSHAAPREKAATNPPSAVSPGPNFDAQENITLLRKTKPI